MKLNKYLTVKETAALWGTPVVNVHQAIRAGRIPCVRLTERCLLVPKAAAIEEQAKVEARRAKRAARLAAMEAAK
jgi:hypothetical protein